MGIKIIAKVLTPTSITSSDGELHMKNVVTLVNSCYRGSSGKQGWTTESDYLDGQRIDEPLIKELVHSSTDHIISFAEKDSSHYPIGCVHLSFVPKSEYATLGMLTVATHRQGQGIGKFIEQWSENYIKKHNIPIVKLHVLHMRSELIAYYQRRGYQKTENTIPFPGHDPRFGIPKRNDLYFIEMQKMLS